MADPIFMATPFSWPILMAASACRTSFPITFPASHTDCSLLSEPLRSLGVGVTEGEDDAEGGPGLGRSGDFQAGVEQFAQAFHDG